MVLRIVEHWELQKKLILPLLAICYYESLSQAMQVKSKHIEMCPFLQEYRDSYQWPLHNTVVTNQ